MMVMMSSLFIAFAVLLGLASLFLPVIFVLNIWDVFTWPIIWKMLITDFVLLITFALGLYVIAQLDGVS